MNDALGADGPRFGWRGAAAWTAVLVVAVGLLAAGEFVSRDPDSRVYSEISAQASQRSIGSWFAPEWWGVAGADEPFREHPFGIFVLPALLARAGFPAVQAGYAIGALYSILAIVLAGRLAALVLGERDSVAVQWALLLLPISFVYRVRANQEYPVLMFLLLAIYATEKARREPRWSVVPPLATVGLLLVKDVFFIFSPLACALWLLCVRDPSADDRGAWRAVVFSLAAAAVAAALYEVAYRQITGDSFMAFFFRYRLTPNTGLDRAVGAGAMVLGRLLNLAWYLARLAWFSVPGGVLLLMALWHRPDPTPSHRASRPSGALLFCLACSVAYVGLMSLGNNRADRFIFPAYFAIGAAGAAVAIRRWRLPSRLAERAAALGPSGTAILWLALFMLTLASAHQLPRVKIWP